MAEESIKTLRKDLEPEVREIFQCIDAGENFLLSGGAGSGKTYSLVKVIEQVAREQPLANIACITYTNAAAEEIQKRVDYKNLSVSTIHDFLWSNIKLYQKELRQSLLSLLGKGEIKGVGDVSLSDNCEIQYKEYTRIGEGFISHNEVLLLANYMFKIYRKLRDILKDKYQFIFVDEYQDTSASIIEIFLDFLPKSDHKNIIGFFGDAMQSIYGDGIGSLSKYVEDGCVYEVKKERNRRNPRLIYELANKLRSDGIQQSYSSDSKAPNMQNGGIKEGHIEFYYSYDDNGLDKVKQHLEWDFILDADTKELKLTHNLIADEAGFRSLMDIYSNDKIIEYRKRISDLVKRKEISDDDLSNLTFGEVIDLLKSKGSTKECEPTKGRQAQFIADHNDLYKIALKQPYEQFRNLSIDKDRLLDSGTSAGSKRDALIAHLFKIQTNINLYKNKQYNDFIRNTEFKIRSIADKRALRDIITCLIGMGDKTIEDVINFADGKGICKIDDKLVSFKKEKSYIYDQVKCVKFREIQALFNYVEGHTPFSTQHKIKGAEFNNVLVVLDNGNWNQYNFAKLFEKLADRKDSTIERTRKLFYVCCTRAKENLAIYYPNPTHDVLKGAESLFGSKNMIQV